MKIFVGNIYIFPYTHNRPKPIIIFKVLHVFYTDLSDHLSCKPVTYYIPTATSAVVYILTCWLSVYATLFNYKCIARRILCIYTVYTTIQYIM